MRIVLVCGAVAGLLTGLAGCTVIDAGSAVVGAGASIVGTTADVAGDIITAPFSGSADDRKK